MDRKSAWDGIRQLVPLRYEFLNEEELNLRGLPASHYAEGEHWGLSAQDVEAVFPELVKDVMHSLNRYGGQERGEDGGLESAVTKSINYTGILVALIATVQEQQMRIEELEKIVKSWKE